MTMIIGGYTSNGSFQALTDNIEIIKKEWKSSESNFKIVSYREGVIDIKQYFTSWTITLDLSISYGPYKTT